MISNCCSYCGENADDYTPDQNDIGFWCDVCDGFTYFDSESSEHRFTLILEDKEKHYRSAKSSNLKFSKRISPYRYPGGKSKMIEYLYSHIREEHSEVLTSPFSGGASFELALLEAGVVKNLVLNDLDKGVYALWKIIIEDPHPIIELLKSTEPDHQDFFKAQQIIKGNYLDVSDVKAAWASLLVNRLAYSGIHKANPLGGKNGSKEKLLQRYRPKELIRRIEKIHSLRKNITVHSMDACELIEEMYWANHSTIFIDPPYVKKGKDLYHCFYNEDDHIRLAELLDSLHKGCPGADIIVTYDYNEWLSNLYWYPKKEITGTSYSI